VSHKTGAGVVISVCDGWFLLQAPKCLLVLTRQQFIDALRRGKAWRRHAALTQRLEEASDAKTPRPRCPDGLGTEDAPDSGQCPAAQAPAKARGKTTPAPCRSDACQDESRPRATSQDNRDAIGGGTER